MLPCVLELASLTTHPCKHGDLVRSQRQLLARVDRELEEAVDQAVVWYMQLRKSHQTKI